MFRQGNRIDELWRFIAVGILNTAVTYLLYILLQTVLFYQIAYAIAYCLGILSSYLFNTLVVFRVPLSWSRGIIYPLIYFVQYVISAVFLSGIVELLDVSEKVGPLVVIVLMTPITFILNKLVIVRDISIR